MTGLIQLPVAHTHTHTYPIMETRSLFPPFFTLEDFLLWSSINLRFALGSESCSGPVQIVFVLSLDRILSHLVHQRVPPLWNVLLVRSVLPLLANTFSGSFLFFLVFFSSSFSFLEILGRQSWMDGSYLCLPTLILQPLASRYGSPSS